MRGCGGKVTNDLLEAISPMAPFLAKIFSAEPSGPVNTLVGALRTPKLSACSEISENTCRRNAIGSLLLLSSRINSRKVAMYGVRDITKAYGHDGIGS
jgi:hypothetical protein